MKFIVNKNILCAIVIFIFTIKTFAFDANSLILDLGDKEKSKSAVEELIKLGENALTPDLFKALDDQNVLVRKNSGLILERIGKTAIPGLTNLINDPKIKDNTKDYAINILGKIKDDSTISIFIDILDFDNPALRSTAIQMIKTNAKAALPFIKAKMDKSQNINFLRSVPSIINNIKTDETQNILLTLLNNPDIEVRKNATYALGNLPTKEVVDTLAKKVLDKKEDFEVLRATAYALKNINSAEAFNAIMDIFRQPGVLIPNCSCEHDIKPVVPKINGELPIFIKEEIFNADYQDCYDFLDKNLDIILKIAQDPKEHIQMHYLMLDLLDGMHTEKTLPFLLESFKTEAKVRIFSLSIMRKIGQPTIPFLIEYITKNPESDNFTGTLGEFFLKTENYSNAFINAYEKGSFDAKKRMIKVLIKANNMNILADISVTAKSDERKFIADVVRELNEDGYFINLLLIKDIELNLLACRNLTMLKSERAIPSLFKLLDTLNNDEKDKLENAIIDTIKKIASKKNTKNYIKDYLAIKSNPVHKKLFKEILIGFEAEIAPDLIENLINTDVEIVKEVTDILINIGSSSASELIKNIPNKNKKISTTVIDILGKMDDGVIQVSINSLISKNNLITFNARNIILNKKEKAIPYLQKNLNNEDIKISILVAEILAEYKDEQAIPTLIKNLSSNDKTISYKAILGLLKFQEKTIDPLFAEWKKQNEVSFFTRLIDKLFKHQLLDDKKLEIFNYNVNETFSLIKKPALNKLIFLVEFYKDKKNKLQILRYLTNTKDIETYSIFIENLSNKDVEIALISINGLISLKNKNAEEPLKKIAKEHSDSKVRKSAELALRQLQ